MMPPSLKPITHLGASLLLLILLTTLSACKRDRPDYLPDCPADYNVIEGGAGDDVLEGTEGKDCIIGHEGNDTIRGRGGDDRIYGGKGDDLIDGGEGDDLIYGNRGDDIIDGGPAKDSSAFREPAAKLYRATSSYKSRAKNWAEHGEKDDWFRDEFSALTAFTHPSKPHTIISVADFNESCGAMIDSFWHIFEAKDQSYTDVLSPAPALLFHFIPTIVADLDGDGQPELFNQDILMQMVGTRYQVIEDIEPPYFDCPC